MKTISVPAGDVYLIKATCGECRTIVELEPSDTLYRDDQREGSSWEWRCPTCGTRQFVHEADFIPRIWRTKAKRLG